MRKCYWLNRMLLPALTLILLLVSCSKDPLDAVREKIPADFKYLAGIFDGERPFHGILTEGSHNQGHQPGGEERSAEDFARHMFGQCCFKK